MLVLLALITACRGERQADPDRKAGQEQRQRRPVRAKAPVPAGGDGSAWFVRAATIPTRVPSVDKRGRPTRGMDKGGGEAAAVFDVDGDGDQDVVVVNGSDYYVVALNDGGADGLRFRARAFPNGREDDEVSNRAKGLGLHDLDGDGLLDLYLATQGKGGLVSYKRDPPDDHGLYRDGGFTTHLSRGDGTFRHVELGIDGLGSKRAAVFDDLDGDGHVDAYVSGASYFGIWYAGGGAPNQLYPGTATGFGPDALDAVFDGPMEGFWVDAQGQSVKNFKAAVLRDFDGDGRADLITGSIADLWANHEQELCDPSEPGYQGTWVRGLFLFHNRSTPGAPRLVDVSHEAFDDPNGVDGQGHVHSIIALDFDHDGDLDLVVSGNKGRMSHNTLEHQSPVLRTFRNDSTPGSLRFVETTADSGVAWMNAAEDLPGPYPIRTRAYETDLVFYPAPMASVPGDFDNDGHVDFVAVDRQTFERDPVTGASYGLHAWLFRGLGDGRFQDVPVDQHGLNGTARDVSVGDLDADGRLDLVFVDGSAGGQHTSDDTTVFANRLTTPHHWLWLRVSTPGDPHGIGVKVAATDGAGRLLGYDEVRTDFSYRSKRDAVVHFGLGAVERVELVLGFRDGLQARVPVAVDRRVQVRRVPLARAGEELVMQIGGAGLEAASFLLDGAEVPASVTPLAGGQEVRVRGVGSTLVVTPTTGAEVWVGLVAP
jgi:hypothetical protein